jgi:4-carboxymuconolactone decarboxylase
LVFDLAPEERVETRYFHGSSGVQLDEAKYTSLPERVRQVVILSVGSVWKADYELYAHTAAARKAGFSETAISSLANGDSSPDLSGGEEARAVSF